MIDIKIRYNTNCTDNHMFWRVLINGVENLASHIIIEIPLHTTRDIVWDPTRNEMVDKHHFTCKASQVEWKGTGAIIK